LNSGVRLALADGSTVKPVINDLVDIDPAGQSGRGMLIVHVISDRWGTEEHHGGKRVWAELQE